MQPYQEEYLSNLRQFAALSQRARPGALSYEQYAARMAEVKEQIVRLGRRNIELLRAGLFPVLDNLFDTGTQELEELEDFSFQLFNGQTELDVGLACQIHQALLSLARMRRDRSAMIRELYWLGLSRNSTVSKLVGLELSDIEEYIARMRLCFTEAAAYLKFYDEIDDAETRGYILRSRANMALGYFKSPAEKVRLIRETLQIMQDEQYREKEPDLPWDRYLYMTHQQMASSISHTKERVMNPEDAASIMESAYIVYQRRIQEAEANSQKPDMRWAFVCCAIEYHCGIYDFGSLLTRLERLLDSADPQDRSPQGMYGIVSLPAFYCQYLSQEPERVPGRAAYVDGLYRRALDYVDTFPLAENEKLALYLWQLAITYLETGGGMPYSTFLQKIMLRFAPDIYLHSWIVGTASRTLCGIILEEEPDFFDDAEEFCAIADPAEKRERILYAAMQSGLLHDVGKICLLQFYAQTARQWLEEEYEVARLHTAAGGQMLSERVSTRPYAAAAMGHHSWYDGSPHGEQGTYKRLECPQRQMVDVISLIDWLEGVTHSSQVHNGIVMSFDEAVEEAVTLEGRRFSPLLTARLRDKRVTERLRRAFHGGWQEAYRQMYDQERSRTGRFEGEGAALS